MTFFDNFRGSFGGYRGRGPIPAGGLQVPATPVPGNMDTDPVNFPQPSPLGSPAPVMPPYGGAEGQQTGYHEPGRLDPPHQVNYAQDSMQVDALGTEAAGAKLINNYPLHFRARSLIVFNRSGHTLVARPGFQIIPPSVFGMVLAMKPAVTQLDLGVLVSAGSSSGAGQVVVVATEEELPPTAVVLAGAGVASSVTISGPLGQAAMAASVPVVIANNQSAIPVSSSGTFNVSQGLGAANLATASLATSTTAGTLVVARPTRVAVTVFNRDTSISVYCGPATVTSANGVEVPPRQSRVFTWVGLIQVISASATPTVDVQDEYN